VLEASHGLKKSPSKKDTDTELQLSFFNLDDPLLEAIREEITALDIDTLTPVEALMQLNQIKRRLSQKKN
jgi:DNA mismatch repair protein MutS